MVCIIAGPAESGRSTVGSLLAETLGWEFVHADNLSSPYTASADSAPLITADSTLSTETLFTAVSFWLYEWRDVVVSCPALIEKDRRRLSKDSPLVKIVLLESRQTGCPSVADLVVQDETSELPAGSLSEHAADDNVVRVDSSEQVWHIIEEITAALIRARVAEASKSRESCPAKKQSRDFAQNRAGLVHSD